MDAHVLHIGADDCHRVAVLRSVGYQVDECLTLQQLASALEIRKNVDAVFVTATDGFSHEHAVSLARQHAAPVILFQNSNGEDSVRQIDLVVEPLTSPSKWLRDVRSLLEWNRGVRAQSKAPSEPVRVLEMRRVQQWDRRLQANAGPSGLLHFADLRTLRS